MLVWIRRYGWLIFLIPFAIYWLDDFLTGWHAGGTQSARAILWENLLEDIAFVVVLLIWRSLIRPRLEIKPFHCTCPHCGFGWVCDPAEIPDRCPRCHKADVPRLAIEAPRC